MNVSLEIDNFPIFNSVQCSEVVRKRVGWGDITQNNVSVEKSNTGIRSAHMDPKAVNTVCSGVNRKRSVSSAAGEFVTENALNEERRRWVRTTREFAFTTGSCDWSGSHNLEETNPEVDASDRVQTSKEFSN